MPGKLILDPNLEPKTWNLKRNVAATHCNLSLLSNQAGIPRICSRMRKNCAAASNANQAGVMSYQLAWAQELPFIFNQFIPVFCKWCVLLFCFSDGSSEQVDKAKAALDPIATPYFEQHKKEDDSVLFFYSNPNDDDIAENLVSFLGLAQTKPLVVLVNIPEQCKYVCKAKELSETAIKEFVDDYLAGTLESMTLRWASWSDYVLISYPQL